MYANAQTEKPHRRQMGRANGKNLTDLIAPDTVAAPAIAEPGDTAPLATSPIAGVAAITLFAGILATIAVVGALYLARAFFVPLLIGILASYALRPIVDLLKAWRIPPAAGAALVLAALIAGTSWAAMSWGDDAAALIEKLPEAARKVRHQVSDTSRGRATSLQQIQDAATELQGAADAAAGDKKTPKSRPQAIRPAEANTWLQDYAIAQTALLANVIAQAPIVMLLVYFLLAAGEHFRRKLVQSVGPTLTAKKDAIRILDEIDSQIQRYLLATVACNILIALGTWLAFEAMGVEHAGAWGVAAGVLHFIPYLGPGLFAIASGAGGFMQFGTAVGAFAVAGASLLVATAIGSLVMTWVQSRVSRVNAAVLFIALLFFGWLWGVWGLLLGAPLLAICKVICDRVEPLKPVGELLGR
jgi:predicted PurR-regulated permease PerM